MYVVNSSAKRFRCFPEEAVIQLLSLGWVARSCDARGVLLHSASSQHISGCSVKYVLVAHVSVRALCSVLGMAFDCCKYSHVFVSLNCARLFEVGLRR